MAAVKSAGRRHHLHVVRTPGSRAAAMHAPPASTSCCSLTAVLTILGLTMVLSAGSVSATQGYDGNPFWYFQRQGARAVVGVIALMVAVRLPHAVWQKIAVPAVVVLVPLMLVALHHSAGSSLYGASRWIDLGYLTLQPSEFMKLAIVAFAATVLTKKWGTLDDPVHLLIRSPRSCSGWPCS